MASINLAWLPILQCVSQFSERDGLQVIHDKEFVLVFCRICISKRNTSYTNTNFSTVVVSCSRVQNPNFVQNGLSSGQSYSTGAWSIVKYLRRIVVSLCAGIAHFLSQVLHILSLRVSRRQLIKGPRVRPRSANIWGSASRLLWLCVLSQLATAVSTASLKFEPDSVAVFLFFNVLLRPSRRLSTVMPIRLPNSDNSWCSAVLSVLPYALTQLSTALSTAGLVSGL